MEGDQLKLLEERIGKAIDFIENLKSREKLHIQEKEELQERVDSLEEEMKEKNGTVDELKERVDSLEEEMNEKNGTIDELKESQVFLKEKIETILGKLESWADMVDVGGYDLDTVPEPEGSDAASQPGNSFEDTKSVFDEEEAAEPAEEEIDTAQEDSSLETSSFETSSLETSKEDPAKSLFDIDEGEEAAEQSPEDEESSDDDDPKNRWPDSGPIDES